MNPHLTEEEIILLTEQACERHVAEKFYEHLHQCQKCLDDFQYMARSRMIENTSDFPEQSLVELGMAAVAVTRAEENTQSLGTRSSRRKWSYRYATIAAAVLMVTAAVWIGFSGPPAAGPGADITGPIFEAMTVASNRSLAVIPGTEHSITTTARTYRSGFVATDEAMSKALLYLSKRYEEGETSRDVVYWLLAGFLSTGQINGARNVARNGLLWYPEDVEIVTLSALAAFFDGEVDEADRLLRSVVEKEPAFEAAAVNLGIVLMEKGDQAGAEEVLARVAGRRPATPLAERAAWLLERHN